MPSPVPVLYRGFVLHPDDSEDPYAFRIDLSQSGAGSARVLFSREPATGVTAAHLDVMPLTLRKQPGVTNPRVWATGALAAGAAITAYRGRRARHRRGAA